MVQCVLGKAPSSLCIHDICGGCRAAVASSWSPNWLDKSWGSLTIRPWILTTQLTHKAGDLLPRRARLDFSLLTSFPAVRPMGRLLLPIILCNRAPPKTYLAHCVHVYCVGLLDAPLKS